MAYKINFIAPAAGDHLQGEGIVLKWGRTLTVCRLEVHAIQAERQMLVAAGQQTLICLPDATSPSARQAGCSGVDSAVPRRHAQSMTQVPGGTVGCDVCGVILVEDKVSLHNEWHRTEDERLEALAQTVRELSDKVADRRS